MIRPLGAYGRMEQSSPHFASPLGRSEDAATEDLALAARAAQGDGEATSQLYARHKDAIYAVAYRILRDAGDAADVLQDTFLLLLEGRRGTPPQTSVRGWLLRVGSNLAIDRLRQRRVRAGSADDRPAESERTARGRDPAAHAEHAELARAIEAAVQDLSPRLRVAVVLRYAGGLSYEEVAEALECSVGTVKSRLARAHARLLGPLARHRAQGGKG
jgi:RNA polymerase sigma-70 factor (ECF subfamily)